MEQTVTDPDAAASLGQTARRPADQPVHLILTAHSASSPQQGLGDWLRRHPEYRNAVRETRGRQDGRAGFSDAVIIAVVAQALLPGLFQVLQTWVAQQRRDTRVRLRVGEAEVEFQVTGRTDPKELLAEVTRSLPAVASQAPAGGTGPAAVPGPTGGGVTPLGGQSGAGTPAPVDGGGAPAASGGEPAPTVSGGEPAPVEDVASGG
ncbi:hypothetical protein [Plantactinospora sp. B5E13]|uniref:effector-associated constant component EACC1 n=1 Tax=unclassified Plantactinospora TaxID=2631981 RepID=UPI00325DBF35